MSNSIDRSQTFLGLPPLKVSNLLKAWRYGRSTNAQGIALRKDVDLNPCMIMVLLEELRDRGLIGPEDRKRLGPIDGLTEAGQGLAIAIGKKRMGGLPSTGMLACSLSDEMPDRLRAVHMRGDGRRAAARVMSPESVAWLG